MQNNKGCPIISRRAALSALLAGSVSVVLPQRLEAALRPDSLPRYNLIDLGTLPGQTSSGANVINNKGLIGGWANDGGQDHALMTTQAILWKNGERRTIASSDTDIFVYHNRDRKVPVKAHYDIGLDFAAVTAINERGDALVCSQLRTYEGKDIHLYSFSWQPPMSTHFWDARDKKLRFITNADTASILSEDGTVVYGGGRWHEGDVEPSSMTGWPNYKTFDPARLNPLAVFIREQKGPSSRPSQLGKTPYTPNDGVFIRNTKGQFAGQLKHKLELKEGTGFLHYEYAPVFWDSEGTPTLIDKPRPYSPSGEIGNNTHMIEPRAINNKGDVVLARLVFNRPNCAYLFTKGKLLDLNTLIPPEVAHEWKLTEARDINDRGQIVGNAKKGGYTRAFLLTPIATP